MSICQVVSHSLRPRGLQHSGSLSLTISRGLPKFMSFESVMPSNRLIFGRPLSPSPFSLSQRRDLCQYFGHVTRKTCVCVRSILPVHPTPCPCGSAGKESACNVGDLGSIPGLGRSPGEGKGYPLQYSGLENSMDESMGSHRVGRN